MKPFVLKGDSALSLFRLKSLIEKINGLDPVKKVTQIKAIFIYLLEIDENLTELELQETCLLLEACDKGQDFEKDEYVVLPRRGTISPWSSKATEIFERCGIKKVKRVERGICYRFISEEGENLDISSVESFLSLFHDKMIEGVYADFCSFFEHENPKSLNYADILTDGKNALLRMNKEQGLALSDDEIDYLYEIYKNLERNPTDVELVMFGQVNSEHCRHKIFNGDWIIDGEKKEKSLFKMIKNTHETHPSGTLIAYNDNSSVISGFKADWFEAGRDKEDVYNYKSEDVDILCKVETHNHPTAISPYPGAATGVGGEIRDEGATGIGGKTKAGLSAFMVSNLNIPGNLMPWEKKHSEFPVHLATPLEIMIEGPIGGAHFGNEFGRPQLCGIFKTLEDRFQDEYYGYHKPIMVAGGMGNIKRRHINKKPLPKGAFIIQIGGPALKIGIGGGAASSMDAGKNALDLDFNSVQRDNAEMERRCQEVINSCIALDDKNPILSIHDVGAGGLSNASPELVAEHGAEFWLRKIFNQEYSMSPMEIWCCEAQERYVLGVNESDLSIFIEIAKRENCPVSVMGKVTGDGHLSLIDDHFNNKPIDIDLKVILGKPPKMLRDVNHVADSLKPFCTKNIELLDAVGRVLRLPAVANKNFLITIADRSITGMVARDQMVGPYQLPLSDVAVTASSYHGFTGEAMAMGERTNIAIISGVASGRMAVGEALTNITAASIGKLNNVKLSANWMCACGEDKEDTKLYDTVKALGMDLCPKLGISIPVGKDSLSMRTVWEAQGAKEEMKAPLSLVISAFASVIDVRKTLTPDLKNVSSSLLLLDLGKGKNRMGASAFAQVYNQAGDTPPDFDDPEEFKKFFTLIQKLIAQELILAYHDRSDGGLFVTLCEMCFGGRKGAIINIDSLGDVFPALFSEELGAVIEVSEENLSQVFHEIENIGLKDIVHKVGIVSNKSEILIQHAGKEIFRRDIKQLERFWSELTFNMQSLRDNPVCAKEEYDNILDDKDPGLQYKFSFNPDEIFNVSDRRPKVAILREQGINGHLEMAAAFDQAGFTSVDVHMNDLISRNLTLESFHGLIACGGFSYGDVLGAGSGWAKSILFNSYLKDMFETFFKKEDTFSLGVCNGCQMLSQLKEIIPGAMHWPHFKKNKSEQFEARVSTVEILKTPSIFFKGMEGSVLPIPVAHGEGQADFAKTGDINYSIENDMVFARYVDNYANVSERYPYNPNGSLKGITGLTTEDGRATIMMPHPERVFKASQLSYKPVSYKYEMSPWMRMFQNSRMFLK